MASTDGVGPFPDIVKLKSTAPGGWLIYPRAIGMNGIKHPLMVFVPAGGLTPATYDTMRLWDLYGSYGFVIYSLPLSSGSDGAPVKAGLDWLIGQNTSASSPLYQMLDTSKVCVAGHSQGSIMVFNFLPDDRVTTTIHITGGSLDGMGSAHLRRPTLFICGEDKTMDASVAQCDVDFMTSTVPTFYTNYTGAAHATTASLAAAETIAWML